MHEDQGGGQKQPDLLVHSVHAGIAPIGRKPHLSVPTATQKLAEELVKVSEQEARRGRVSLLVAIKQGRTHY